MEGRRASPVVSTGCATRDPKRSAGRYQRNSTPSASSVRCDGALNRAPGPACASPGHRAPRSRLSSASRIGDTLSCRLSRRAGAELSKVAQMGGTSSTLARRLGLPAPFRVVHRRAKRSRGNAPHLPPSTKRCRVTIRPKGADHRAGPPWRAPRTIRRTARLDPGLDADSRCRRTPKAPAARSPAAGTDFIASDCGARPHGRPRPSLAKTR